MKFYTYAIINEDLIRDDPSSAETIPPVQMWTTKEKALAAFVKEMNVEADEYNEDVDVDDSEERMEFDVDDFEWTERDNGDRETFVEEFSYTVRMYAMDVVD